MDNDSESERFSGEGHGFASVAQRNAPRDSESMSHLFSFRFDSAHQPTGDASDASDTVFVFR